MTKLAQLLSQKMIIYLSKSILSNFYKISLELPEKFCGIQTLFSFSRGKIRKNAEKAGQCRRSFFYLTFNNVNFICDFLYLENFQTGQICSQIFDIPNYETPLYFCLIPGYQIIKAGMGHFIHVRGDIQHQIQQYDLQQEQ